MSRDWRGPQATPADVEALPFSLAYQTLGQLAPFILEHQSKGTIAAVSLNRQKPDQQIKVGGYILNVGLTRNRRAPAVVPDVTGYGIFYGDGARRIPAGRQQPPDHVHA